MSVQDRNRKVQGVIESLERDMELLCLTGVEDKLQDGVRPTLEMLKNAGIKVIHPEESHRHLTNGCLTYIIVLIAIVSWKNAKLQKV
jgi:hypothetical protein